MKVTAIKRGFIYGKYRREGDVFDLRSESHFSDYWMSKGNQEVKEPEIKHANLKKETTFNSCDVKYPKLETPHNVMSEKKESVEEVKEETIKRKRRTKAEILADKGE